MAELCIDEEILRDIMDEEQNLLSSEPPLDIIQHYQDHWNGLIDILKSSKTQ